MPSHHNSQKPPEHAKHKYRLPRFQSAAASTSPSFTADPGNPFDNIDGVNAEDLSLGNDPATNALIAAGQRHFYKTRRGKNPFWFDDFELKAEAASMRKYYWLGCSKRFFAIPFTYCCIFMLVGYLFMWFYAASTRTTPCEIHMASEIHRMYGQAEREEALLLAEREEEIAEKQRRESAEERRRQLSASIPPSSFPPSFADTPTVDFVPDIENDFIIPQNSASSPNQRPATGEELSGRSVSACVLAASQCRVDVWAYPAPETLVGDANQVNTRYNRCNARCMPVDVYRRRAQVLPDGFPSGLTFGFGVCACTVE